jgi:hypothetical protein
LKRVVADDALELERTRTGVPGFRLKDRVVAAATHLSISSLVASVSVSLVFLGWYQAPLAAICGVGSVLTLLIAADVVLGPFLTFLIFDRRKRRLRADLACIAVLQVAALAYGMHAIEVGRPHYLVFVKDRFEVVSKADLRPADQAAAAANPSADRAWSGARIVAAEFPASIQERNELLLEAVTGGRDLQHLPKQYRPYETQSALAAGRAIGLRVLRALNPDGGAVIDEVVRHSGLPEERLGYLPVRGPRGDASMILDRSSGAIVEMVGLVPWVD